MYHTRESSGQCAGGRWKPSRGTAAGKTGGEAGKRDTAHHGGKSLCGRDYGKR